MVDGKEDSGNHHHQPPTINHQPSTSMTPDPYAQAQRVMREADCLHDASAVQGAYDRLAQAVTADFKRKNPLVLCVMLGGLVPTVEITKRLAFAFELDYLHATRYRGATKGGGLIWKRQQDKAVAGRHVLVIDDILDEGNTLAAIRKALGDFRPEIGRASCR